MTESDIRRPDLLETIIAATRRIVDVRQAQESSAALADRAAGRPSSAGRFQAALARTGGLNVIAECKRRSPSRGVLRWMLALPAAWVRRGDWKLIRFFCDNPDQTDRFELYNLKDDIGETRNLAADNPGKSERKRPSRGQ